MWKCNIAETFEQTYKLCTKLLIYEVITARQHNDPSNPKIAFILLFCLGPLPQSTHALRESMLLESYGLDNHTFINLLIVNPEYTRFLTTFPYTIRLNIIYHLLLGIPSGLLTKGLTTKILYAFLPRHHVTWPANLNI
jgi:hypothetical protein